MGGGLKELAMRARAREWKGKASAAVADGGSSDRATQDFVEAVLSIGTGCSRKKQEKDVIEGLMTDLCPESRSWIYAWSHNGTTMCPPLAKP
ncbi:UDP-glycosyltransferase 84A1-like [Panicum miliaceum]|uniref:UDP-glycosyltransferase 84A1-like n=1 Tax=Panicum miliaceum TaxID=4540 RepID=A0A3L6PIU9_PANMI|nr:UDP-glycosyltransferase 84A1-like [Panicum miliaceum]